MSKKNLYIIGAVVLVIVIVAIVGLTLPTRRSATLVSQEDNEDLTLVVSTPTQTSTYSPLATASATAHRH